MEFLISESQLRTILMEQDKSKMSGYMKKLYSFTNNMVNRVSKSYGLNLKMLLTWGASVGGMVMPLDNYLKTNNFNMTDDQRYLVLAGVAFMFFFESNKSITKILEKIKEEGLEDVFNDVMNKGLELKESFKSFLSTINVTISSFLDTVAYSFLIPIIVDIQSIVANSTNLKESSILIAERLIASGVVTVGAKVLANLIRKISERIK
jgi:hypothetical protein